MTLGRDDPQGLASTVTVERQVETSSLTITAVDEDENPTARARQRVRRALVQFLEDPRPRRGSAPIDDIDKLLDEYSR